MNVALGGEDARRFSERVAHLADGPLAATVFAATFAVIGSIALANRQQRPQ